MERDSDLVIPQSVPATGNLAGPLPSSDERGLPERSSSPPPKCAGSVQTEECVNSEPISSCDQKMAVKCKKMNSGSAMSSGAANFRYMPRAVVQSTPVSSLPAGSLVRHLALLREKQYLLRRCSPSGDPQEQSSVLQQNENSGCVDLPPRAPHFTTSTPQVGLQRHPLHELPVTACGNAKLNVVPPAGGGPSACMSASESLSGTDENLLPGSTFAAADLATPRQYDPNSYRSPPKLPNGETDKFSRPELRGGAQLASGPTTSAKSSGAGALRESPVAPGAPVTPRDDDRPLSTSNKSFEELLSEKLKDKSHSSSTACYGPSKRFLKKGAGTSRFAKAGSGSASGSWSEKQNLSSKNVCAKTCKPKFSYLKKGTGSRRYNIKSVRLKKSVGAQKLTLGTEKIEALQPTADGGSDQTLNEMFRIEGDHELHFMSPIRRVSYHRESEELKAFEALEELAEHSSFCSDASTVNSLLRRGLEGSVSSTPAGSPSARRCRDVTDTLAQEARRLASCTDSPHPQRGGAGAQGCCQSSPEAEESEGGGARAKKSVQFCKDGAQVLEYRAHEDSGTEATLSCDASDVLSVSDLEFLNEMNNEGKLPAALRVESVPEGRSNRPDARSAARHPVLQFSPPKIPRNAASHAVWEAFGRRGKADQPRQAGGGQSTSTKGARPALEPRLSVPGPAAQDERRAAPQRGSREEELEAHKVLLVSKVHELEKEIKTFQNENAVLTKLRKTFVREKELFEREKRMFDERLERERRCLEERFETERNRLWKEKCSLQSNKDTKPQNDNVLEIINLKEEILMLKNELERRESMNNFTVNKLKNRIKELTSERKDWEAKQQRVSSLEKENMALKHQVDRLKLASRAPCAGPKPAVRLARNAPGACDSASQAPSKQTCSEDAPRHKSVSFVDGNSTGADTSAPKRNACGDGTAGAKESPGSIESYLANLPCEASRLKTPTSVAFNSSASLSCVEENLSDGSKVITYANGNKKQILPSGCVIHEYYNGDRKETYPDRVVYFYSSNGTRQTTYTDGSEELQFPNGQTEIKRADTSIEVIFPDKSKTVKLPDGTEVHHNLDGTVVTSTPSGEKVFKFVSGQREVHGLGFKRREYPDGTTKVVYDDGTSETTYPNGRIRVKDQHGNVVSDTKLGLDLTHKFSAL